MRRAALALALAACAAAHAAGTPDTWSGEPRSERAGAITVLSNPGFRVGYSEARRQPLWVAFRAASLKGSPRVPPRPKGFEIDQRTRARVSTFDYTGSRYDRGHLAPNYLIGRLYGREAQRATFLMSNIAPQRARLNQLVWQRLEEAESDKVAPRAGELWVVTGPVFGAQPRTLKSGIPVPDAFYRIWLDLRDAGAPAALGFVVPQQVCGTEPLGNYLASVDEIEQRTGLDFFSELDDPREAALESTRTAQGWQLWRFDRLPPRYAEKFDLEQCES